MIWLNNVAVINIRKLARRVVGYKVFQPSIFSSFRFNIVCHNKNMSILIKNKKYSQLFQILKSSIFCPYL